MQFDDAAADEMALLAMAQFGRALAALGTRCVMAETLGEIARAQQSARVPVWSPLALRPETASLPRNWDVTSDSLAAWLAARLGARLLLVKRMRPAPGATLHELAQAGLVDRAFPLAAAGLGGVWIAGPDDRPGVLDPDAPPGVAVATIAAAA
jgi:dihydroneopterin aldolase